VAVFTVTLSSLITWPPAGHTTTRRRDDTTFRKITKSHEENPASHVDGFCPLVAPRFARWQE